MNVLVHFVINGFKRKLTHHPYFQALPFLTTDQSNDIKWRLSPLNRYSSTFPPLLKRVKKKGIVEREREREREIEKEREREREKERERDYADKKQA